MTAAITALRKLRLFAHQRRAFRSRNINVRIKSNRLICRFLNLLTQTLRRDKNENKCFVFSSIFLERTLICFRLFCVKTQRKRHTMRKGREEASKRANEATFESFLKFTLWDLFQHLLHMSPTACHSCFIRVPL